MLLSNVNILWKIVVKHFYFQKNTRTKKKMPELPEVETIVRILNKSFIINSLIRSIKIVNQKLKEILFFERKTVKEIKRKGKFIVFYFLETDKCLIVHLRMTGFFFLSPPAEEKLIRGISFIFFFEDNLLGKKDKCLIVHLRMTGFFFSLLLRKKN